MPNPTTAPASSHRPAPPPAPHRHPHPRHRPPDSWRGGMIRNRGGYWQVRVYAGLDPCSGRKHVRELAPTTLVGYRHFTHRILAPRLGQLPVTQVTTGDLEQLYAELRRTGAVRGTPLAASTIRSIHSVVNSAFTRAVVWSWATTNPALPATLPQSPATAITPPTVEQVTHLLDRAHADDPALAMLVRPAAVTGARRGELCALRWTDVDWDHGELAIVRSIAAVPGHGLLIRPTKNRTRRRIALDPHTLALLRAHRVRTEQAAARAGAPLDPGGYLVAAIPDGAKPLHPDDCTTRFRHLRGGPSSPAGCTTCATSWPPSCWSTGSTCAPSPAAPATPIRARP